MGDDTGSDFLTRAFAAGELSFTVGCASTQLRDLVEDLFEDLEEGSAVGVQTSLRLVEEQGGEAVALRLLGSAGSDLPPVPPDIALDLLVSAVNRLSRDADRDRLHLHAGGVAHEDRGVIIAGRGGVGKSSLTAGMLLRGWDYLSDEMVALTADASTMSGFAKPLTIKPAGHHLFSGLTAHRVAPDCSSQRTPTCQIPVTRLGVAATSEAKPVLLVLLQRDRGRVAPSAPTWVDLHPADAVVALADLVLDAPRHGPEVLPLLGNLVHRCRSVQVNAGSPTATAALVEELSETTAKDGETPILVPSVAHCYLADARIADSVSTLLLRDRVVIHDARTGKIGSFNDSGSAVWLALGGAEPETFPVPDSELPGVASFLRELRSEGFLTSCSSTEATDV